ncbi:RNA polymerase sigma factor [Candidatus Dojkabacteria bacterium]|uniref:RNA polymerase sigma factor n=1 Tax=Candidatus Dojkabacteria bacterium TaxID=2099670 RepID=A0A955I9H1_9BACT|nr:RNA polymerase sigma factor [Candidatus Dojkabacteria bacterium]
MEKIFIDFHLQIYRYIYYKTGQKKELAEDLTEDVFVKVWTNRDSYKPEVSSIKSWVYAIARYHVIDYYRKNKNIYETSENEDTDYDKNDNLNQDEGILIDEVKEGLSRLEKKDRDVIILRYINSLSIEEISELIHKKSSATKVMIHRALKHLKKVVDSYDY